MVNIVPTRNMIPALSAYSMMYEGAALTEQGGQYNASLYRQMGKKAMEGAKLSSDIFKQSAIQTMIGAGMSADMFNQAGETALKGAKFQADVYRQSGHAATIASNYNIALDQRDTAQKQDAVSRQIHGILNQNTASVAKNGIALGSKSAIMVQNQVMAVGQKQIIQLSGDAQQRQSLMIFQGKLAKMEYENQARAAEFQGAVQKQEYQNKAIEALYQGAVSAQEYENKSRVALYQGELDKMQYENQARAEIYRSQVDAWKQRREAVDIVARAMHENGYPSKKIMQLM